MSFYKVKCGDLIFYAKVEDRPKERRSIIMFGSARFQDCLSIHVFGKSKIAELHGVIYNRLCATNMPMPKGHGTIRMIKAAMKFVLKMFQHIKTFELTDNSQIECGKFKISLSDMYFATRGKTWYESKFDAIPDFTGYEELKQEFQKKPIFEFDDLWDQYLQDGQKLYKYEKEYYAQKYHVAISWFAFLNTWMQEEGCRPFVWLSDTPIGILSIISENEQTLHGKNWKITKQTVDSYDPINVRPVPLTSFPDIQWREEETSAQTGGMMLFPEETAYE